MDAALQKEDHAAYAEMQSGKQAAIQQRLAAAEQKLATIPEEDRFTSGEVSADDVAEVISRWTGIPVNKMLQNDKERLLGLEAELGKRLIGQKKQ